LIENKFQKCWNLASPVVVVRSDIPGGERLPLLKLCNRLARRALRASGEQSLRGPVKVCGQPREKLISHAAAESAESQIAASGRKVFSNATSQLAEPLIIHALGSSP
jgi:hypothetical protein